MDDISVAYGLVNSSRNFVAVRQAFSHQTTYNSSPAPVTCIPLDAPERKEINQTRPPWIRPVRKKRDSVVRSSGGPGSSSDSQHGSPEGSSSHVYPAYRASIMHSSLRA